MTFDIEWSDIAARHFAKLDRPIQIRIKKSVESKLIERPEVYGKPLRYSLKGLWSLRIGDYRVLYTIERSRIKIITLAHRRDVYR